MRHERLIRYLYYILLTFIVLGVSVNELPLSDSFKEIVIAEIIGSGMIAVVIAAFSFYLQESKEYRANKQKSVSFLVNKLLPEIEEAIERGNTQWNLSGENKFYFDNSIINPLFDVYQSNFTLINDYSAYYPSNELTSAYGEFYRLTRKGYVFGEKLNNIIYQIVRTEHYKRKVDALNDFTMRSYVKAKLFANFSSESINKYLEWDTAPERAEEILKTASGDKTTTSLSNEIEKIRKKLIKMTIQISKLSNSYNRQPKTYLLSE